MSEQPHYDLLVLIGRFSPFHVGHRRVVELALEQSKHLLILVGSSFQPRTVKNPFTFQERHDMILASLDPFHISRLTIRPLRDYLYNEQQWISSVQQSIDVLDLQTIIGGNPSCRQIKIGLIGYEKDESSYYLKKFPQYDFIDVGCNYIDTISATTIRELWFNGNSPRFAEGAVHKYVYQQVFEKFPKKEYDRLVREYRVIAEVKKQWANSPFPVLFVTTDAVVIQSGHVLMVQRKAAPGEGLWAMPGGYLNVNETIVDGMIRELREETKIKVPEPVLRGSIKAKKEFDAPTRSLRGRIITHAFLIELPPGPLPKVKGSDDAAKAKWVPLNEFEQMEEQMFEDHHHIIKYFLGRI